MKLDELIKYKTQTKEYWSGIKQYVLEHFESDKKISPSTTDNSIMKFINKRFNCLSPGEGDAKKERDNFRKCTKGLCDGTHSSTDRLNQYRLIFALKSESQNRDEIVNEANHFLLRHLLEPELSPRNLLDFIIIASLKKGLNWVETYTLYKKYEGFVKNSNTAPDNLEEGYTKILFNMTNEFEDAEDLALFLSDPDHLKYFATTCNTRYLALFDSFIIKKKANSIKIIDDIDNHDEDGNLRITRVRMTELYNSIFGLANMDDNEELNNENSLTADDLSALSVIYPSVFMTYDTFRTLVQRSRREEISHGVMLLKLLEQMDPNPESRAYINFSDPAELKHCIRLLFLMVGLPDISEKDIFDKLVIDTYNEILQENPEDSSIDIKSKFIRRLRAYCKIIANL